MKLNLYQYRIFKITELHKLLFLFCNEFESLLNFLIANLLINIVNSLFYYVRGLYFYILLELLNIIGSKHIKLANFEILTIKFASMFCINFKLCWLLKL